MSYLVYPPLNVIVPQVTTYTGPAALPHHAPNEPNQLPRRRAAEPPPPPPPPSAPAPAAVYCTTPMPTACVGVMAVCAPPPVYMPVMGVAVGTPVPVVGVGVPLRLAP
ncbi:45960ca9-c103-46cd-96e2-b292a23af387 [Thermothielavioides terrestris]|uniref:45960ca9-c103-46cd-96e2-b292a23af387 n=1 Tax=Thermothielavioides terrestris TaxID=2587410 RepID=A0A3S4AL11_9PEZI|nr:45960ca9-c103-46cd-96e2-b292a23af387 [Thermothielavioides terrestris]